MKETTRPRIYSVGHSNRTFDEFVYVLKGYNIKILADIRSWPRSRRNPQFDREHLAQELPAQGISYVWIKELGGMRQNGYEKYMETEDFMRGLDKLISEAEEKRAAFMCSELLWRNCHRSFVAQALHAKGWDVVHIYDENETEMHTALPSLGL